jgi:hypothetical protein
MLNQTNEEKGINNSLWEKLVKRVTQESYLSHFLKSMMRKDETKALVYLPVGDGKQTLETTFSFTSDGNYRLVKSRFISSAEADAGFDKISKKGKSISKKAKDGTKFNSFSKGLFDKGPSEKEIELFNIMGKQAEEILKSIKEGKMEITKDGQLVPSGKERLVKETEPSKAANLQKSGNDPKKPVMPSAKKEVALPSVMQDSVQRIRALSLTKNAGNQKNPVPIAKPTR